MHEVRKRLQRLRIQLQQYRSQATEGFLYINGVALASFDVDDAEAFMNDVATRGDLDIEYIASKLAQYASSPSP